MNFDISFRRHIEEFESQAVSTIVCAFVMLNEGRTEEGDDERPSRYLAH